jgi:hypothetical protein
VLAIVRLVLCECLTDTLRPKGMLHYRRGHGLEPPYVVRVVSNNGVHAMPFSFDRLADTRPPDEPYSLPDALVASFGACFA